MREHTIYTCEVCNGSYANKDLALKCETSGNPKHYNEFLNKWIIAVVQILEEKDTHFSSSVNSYVTWFPVRVENNEILSPSNFAMLSNLQFVAIAHSLKLTTRSIFTHTIIKEYLDQALVIPDKYYDTLNQLLVENEQLRKLGGSNNEIELKIEELVYEISKELNIDLTLPKGVEKYEYQSK